MNTPNHDEVRKLAFLKWEAAGRPEGQELEHWLAAEREILTQAEVVATELSAPQRKAAPRKRATPASAPKAAKPAKAEAAPKKPAAKRTTKKKES